MRSVTGESLNKDLTKISAWSKLWGMKMKPIKTQCITVSRFKMVFPSYTDLFIDNVPLTMCNSFKILGVILVSKYTFEHQLCSVSSSVAQKTALLRKSFLKFLGISQSCRNVLIPLFYLVLSTADLSILTEFLSNRLQRVVVDGQFNDYRNVISGVPQGSVLGPLLFIWYTHDTWFGLENKLVSYADDATLLARIPSPNMRSDVTESLNRDLSKISTLCNLWGMRLNPSKTQSMIVSRSRTVFPPHPDLLVGSTSLNSCDFF